MEKIFAVYKPKGPTSHDIIDRIRKITGERRVGHAGTLDPLARGVLVIGVGREATKRLQEAVSKEKEYRAVVRLGSSSATDDEEGSKQSFKISHRPTLPEIRKVIALFIGRIPQVPPAFSALKRQGKPAYALARKGIPIPLQAREIEIHTIQILSYRWPDLRLRVVTGPGAYIRALARDIGEKLGTGGYLADLERTRVGEFGLESALTLEELAERWPLDSLHK